MGRGKKNHWDGPNEGKHARYEKIHRKIYRGDGGSGIGDGGQDGGGGDGGADVDKISKLFFFGFE